MPVAYCSKISAGTTHKLNGLSVGRDGNSLYGLIEDTWALHGGKPGMKEGDRYFGQVCAMETMIMHAFALMIFCTLSHVDGLLQISQCFCMLCFPCGMLACCCCCDKVPAGMVVRIYHYFSSLLI